MMRLRDAIAISIVAPLLWGCGGVRAENSVANAEPACTDGKCDTPDDDPNFDVAKVCEDRRAEMLESNQDIFTEDFIRWSCADVRGVNTNNVDSRGQEYCEYFAAVRPPPASEGGEYGAPVTLGRPLSEDEGDVTPLGLELSDDQIYYIEDHIDEVFGSCYFTSWHLDYESPYPACANDEECVASFEGLPLDAGTFRMKLPFNGNEAAFLLVKDCLGAVLAGQYDTGNTKSPDNEFSSDFLRGCHLADGYGLAWRKSDSSICSSVMRLGECGCATDAEAVAGLLVPPPSTGALRGFPLGSWGSANAVGAGCEYVDTGDDSRTLVRCDLTGADVLQAQTDLKGYCKSKYAENVVVHVPIPAEQLSCTPGDGAFADTCSATPWVVTQ